jgi:hypothetical protein
MSEINPPPKNCNVLDVLSTRLSQYVDFYLNNITRDNADFDSKLFLDNLKEINVRSNVKCPNNLQSKVLEMYLLKKEEVISNNYGSTKLIYSNLINVNVKKPSDLNKKKYSLNKLKRKNVTISGLKDQSTCVKSMIKYLKKHKSDLADLKSFEMKNKVTFEKRSDSPKIKPTKALVTMASVKIKGNHFYFIMKMFNKRNLTNVNPDTDNLLINFIKVNGIISKDVTNDKIYTLSTSKIQYFLNYTDFNPNNPDASVNVNKVHIEEWITKYNLAKNPSADSNILPYCPSTIVSYNNGQNRLNYICNITNITTDANANGETNLIFTFETSKVQFIDKIGETIKNDPARTKIDTVFMEGAFNDIRIDFDPLYDPKYKYNGDFSYFLQGDLMISKTKNNKFLGSLPMETNFIGYRSWNPTNKDRNDVLEVFCDDITSFTHLMPTRDSTISFTPSTTIEYVSNDGVTSTNIVQIKDASISKHNDNGNHKVFFELDNEFVKFFNNKNGYKSVSNTLKEGIYYDARMDIDSGGCGTMPGPGKWTDTSQETLFPPACYYQGCYWQGYASSNGWLCCKNKATGCADGCCSACTSLLTCNYGRCNWTSG